MRVLMTAAVGALVAVLAAPAVAADLPDPPPITYPPLPEAMGGAFYVRLDAGYALRPGPQATLSWPEEGYVVPGTGEFADESLANAVLAGIGVGYDFGHLRTDITIDHTFAAAFAGDLGCVGCDPAGVFAETTTIAAWTVLANAYFDVGDGPITPYLGAGIGFAALTTTGIAFTNPDLAALNADGSTTRTFAWSLSAGISARVSERIAVDIGYRLVRTGNAVISPANGPDGAGPVVIGNLVSHELRLGIRFSPH